MSVLSETLKGVKQLLLLQEQIKNLEEASNKQSKIMEKLADKVIDLDKRLVRIETMVEMSTGRASGNPALPEN